MPLRGSRLKPVNLLAWAALFAVVVLLGQNWRQPAPDPRPASTETTVTPAPDSTATPAPAKRPVEGEVAVDLLNFRAKKELSDQTVIAPLTRGTVVKVLEKEERWLFVELADGRRGYVAYDPRYVHFTEMEER